MKTIEANCTNCAYADYFEADKNYNCRRYPSTASNSGNNQLKYVTDKYWCGEWKEEWQQFSFEAEPYSDETAVTYVKPAFMTKKK